MISHRGTEDNEVGVAGVVAGADETEWEWRGVGGTREHRHAPWAVRSKPTRHHDTPVSLYALCASVANCSLCLCGYFVFLPLWL